MDQNLSAEEVDSDDMAGDLCESDEEDGENRRADFKAVRNEKRSNGILKPASKKFRQEFDTNVFEVKLDCLENKGKVVTGDAHLCKTCASVFSNISKISGKITKDGEEQIWICEFCNTKNVVNLDYEEIPLSGSVTYLTEPVL